MSWSTINIGNLVERGEAEVKTGPFGTQLRASDYVEKGTPVINVRNIGLGSIRPEKLEYIPEDVVERLSGHLLRKGDIVFGRKGAVERHVYVKPAQDRWFQGSDCLRLRLLSEESVLSKYLSFTFLTHEHQSWMMQQCSHGATMASLNQDIIKRITVRLPSIEEQRFIVSILSAYDDLIENNTRRIEILEEIARRLYEEWFVHFRFPGHEEVSFKESELGRIPEGWEVGNLQDIIVLQRGFDLPVKKRTPGDFPIVSASGVSGTHVEAKIDGPGVVTGRSGSIGKVMYIHGSYWPLNTTLWGKAFPLGSSLFAFYTLSAIDLKGFNVGAAVPTLNRNNIHGLPVALPAKEVVQLFDQVAGPIHELMVTLEKKNANLRAQRDLLLPKLVSGEIDVSDIPMPDDKEVEAA